MPALDLTSLASFSKMEWVGVTQEGGQLELSSKLQGRTKVHGSFSIALSKGVMCFSKKEKQKNFPNFVNSSNSLKKTNIFRKLKL